MAKKLQMPLVVHLRGEEEAVVDEATQIMKEELGVQAKTIGIHMHCFTYSLRVAEEFLKDFPKVSQYASALICPTHT